MRRALIGIALLALGGAAHAQDYSTSEYCDPICLQHSLSSPPDCSYHTWAQCEASRSGTGGMCVTNPFLSMCSRGSAAHQPVHRSRRVR